MIRRVSRRWAAEISSTEGARVNGARGDFQAVIPEPPYDRADLRQWPGFEHFVAESEFHR